MKEIITRNRIQLFRELEGRLGDGPGAFGDKSMRLLLRLVREEAENSAFLSIRLDELERLGESEEEES